MTIHDLVATAAVLVLVSTALANSYRTFRHLKGESERKEIYLETLSYIGQWREWKECNNWNLNRQRGSGDQTGAWDPLSAHELNWRLRVFASNDVRALWASFRGNDTGKFADRLENCIIREMRDPRAARVNLALLLGSALIAILTVTGTCITLYNILFNKPLIFRDPRPEKSMLVTDTPAKHNSADLGYRVSGKPSNSTSRFPVPHISSPPTANIASSSVAIATPRREPTRPHVPILCISCGVTQISDGLISTVDKAGQIVNDTLGGVSGLLATQVPAVAGTIGGDGASGFATVGP